MITNDNSEFIQSIGKLDERLLILINLQKLLSQTESQELQKVA
jgi:chemotaxis signal transduction protein